MSGKTNPKDNNAFPQGKKNQDLLQRLNHLYQANTYLASLANDSTRTTDLPNAGVRSKTAEKGKRKDEGGSQRKSLDTLGVAVRKSNHRFKVMVKHNILATDPSLKRSFCKGCNTICIPGHNARVRVKPSKIHGNRIITTCLTCSTTRTIPAPPTEFPANETATENAFPAAAVSTALSESQSIVPLDSQTSSVASAEIHARKPRPLDGVNRSAKRQRMARKAQFSRKEAVQPGRAEGPFQGTKDSDENMTTGLVSAIPVDSNPMPTCDAETAPANAPKEPSSIENLESQDLPQVAPTKQKQQKGQKGQKQKGKNAGKGGNSAAQPAKQDGHSLWRGDELVKGWGDPVPAHRQASTVE